MYGIDFTFVSGREGGQRLNGYVPIQKGLVIGNSGVTIATGVDIGQMSITDLNKLKIPQSLRDKLAPYTLITKMQASQLIKRKPLSITKREADLLDKAIQETHFVPLVNRYNRDSMVPFHKIPKEAQTVLGSLAWHYGAGFMNKEKFNGLWNCAIYQNWDGLSEELRAYRIAVQGIKNRRALEANLIDKIGTTAFV